MLYLTLRHILIGKYKTIRTLNWTEIETRGARWSQTRLFRSCASDCALLKITCDKMLVSGASPPICLAAEAMLGIHFTKVQQDMFE